MDAQTVASRLDQVQLVDVRYESEWDVGHIEGAVNIPEEDFDARVGEIDRTRPVVTVCRAGTRSAEAAEWLRGEGFDAESLDGGMLSWKWAGLPITGRIAEPAANPMDVQAFHDELIEVALALQARFGADAKPSEEEIRGFLRERMIGEGKTPEEADAFLSEMGGE
jgi:rhodanese-related sulfurtransferase